MGLAELLNNFKEKRRQKKLEYELKILDVIKQRAMHLTDIIIKKETYPQAYIKTKAFNTIYVNTKEFRIGFTEEKAYDGEKLEHYLKQGDLDEILGNVDFLWIRRPYHHNFHQFNLESEAKNKLKRVFNEVKEHYRIEKDKISEVEKLLQLREDLIDESSLGSRNLNIIEYNSQFDISLIAYKNYTFIVTKNDESGSAKGRDFVEKGGDNVFVGDYFNVGIVRQNAVMGTKEEFEKIIEKCQDLERRNKKFGKLCFPEGRGKKTFSLEIMKGCYQKTKIAAVRYISIIDKENLKTALGLYKNIDF